MPGGLFAKLEGPRGKVDLPGVIRFLPLPHPVENMGLVPTWSLERTSRVDSSAVEKSWQPADLLICTALEKGNTHSDENLSLPLVYQVEPQRSQQQRAKEHHAATEEL